MPMRVLILGGTGFLGPHVVRYALSRNHEVTLFNRGLTNATLFPEVEKLRGDRDGDLTALEGRRWDAVIDTSGYVPRIVRRSVQMLNESCAQYLFVSTLSVYADFSRIGMDENAPCATLKDPTVEDIKTFYGPLKALCELEVNKALPGRATIVRPGLIVGPGDGSDRFTYWPVRLNRGGEVLAPGDPADPVSLIDVRDLAEWCVRMLEDQETGVYNAVGPKTPLSMTEFLHHIHRIGSPSVKFTWVDADFLSEHGVQPWTDMPVWMPPRPGYEGFHRFSRDRAVQKGLAFRSLEETARDTLEWFNTLPEERKSRIRVGLSAEREAEILRLFHTREALSAK